MAIDYNKINRYLDKVRKAETVLVDNQDLFNDDKLIEFKHITSALEQNVELSKNKSRKLSIGIVGAVKAGKSSFLNACIFNGEDFLPKAATPMTAALTKITYSETPKAIIHFYTRDDWDTIEKQSKKYDEELEKGFDEYCKGKRNAQISQDEYEKKHFDCKSENYCSAKELIRMAKDPQLMEKLGTTDEIDGDVIAKMNDYVGANGHYTPIVSYVELQIDNHYMKDFEIVDTPGLNDTVVSRGIKTKQFLRECDVVLLLSPCSQFMDAQTVELMANSLPEAGVREILVVGSKLDSGILNENAKDFKTAYSKSINSYNNQFRNNLDTARKNVRSQDMLNMMSVEKILFASSTCFAIGQKLKKGVSLDANETVVYNNLHKNFNDFNDSYFNSLGGFTKVKSALNEVLNRKNEIIEGKNSEFLDKSRLNHVHALENILQETISRRSMLETESKEELIQKSSLIRNVIDSSRKKLMYIFDSAAIECDKKVQNIKPQLTLEIAVHGKLDVETKSHSEFMEVKKGLFGMQKETIQYDVTERQADVNSVIKNITEYISRCIGLINDVFDNIINTEAFAHRIKDIVLEAFQKSDKAPDEDEILLPLRNVLAKISIPHIEYDITPYIDEVNTVFKEGYAGNDDIHKLSSLQASCMNRITKEISAMLDKALADITKTLKMQAVSFADKIQGEFCNEIEKLEKQIDEKEHYIIKYSEFTESVREMKKNLFDE